MRRPTFLVFCLGFSFAAAAQDNLRVLPPKSEEAFENWLVEEINQLIDLRTAAFEKAIKSASACRAWQEERRRFFVERIGGLPERVPLNAKVMGVLEGKGYRVEKILLETRPAFHLTGNLYVPDSPPPWPAVIVPCGHSHDGKAAGQYQLACRLLARHGMAALCYDPVGQGERYQMLDLKRARDVFEDAPHVKTPHPNTRLICTTEHTMMGLGSALLGANVAQFRIWDGMRVIDYLQAREDIIADKIGCTGNSGGGTETAYLMALDDRIVAAAPGCYLTTFRKLIETKGPQDGEQNIFGQIAFGMDEADYCIMRAPKPTLICAGTRDVTFDFGGTMDLFREAKRFYSRLGHADRMDIAAPDAPHGFTLQLREAVTRFMGRWLLGRELDVREVPSLPDTFDDEQLRGFSKPDFTADQLQCTPDGQVLLLPGERSVFQINAALAAGLKPQRDEAWRKLDDHGRRELVGRTIGLEAGRRSPRVQMLGKIERRGCTIHKLALAIDGDFRIPALAFVPQRPGGRAMLYLHGSSMAAEAAPGGAIDRMVRGGALVLAAELRGIGETETGLRRRAHGAGRFGRDLLEILEAYLMGRSYVGMRTGDILCWTTYLRSGALTGGKPAQVNMMATGEATIPALHAAALSPQDFDHVTLTGMIGSWDELVAAEESFDQAVNVVHGALRHYDLPDLAKLAGEGKVSIENPVDTMGRPRRR